MSYPRFVRIVEKDYGGDLDKIDREVIKKKLKCGDLQYAAFKGRLEAEREGKARAAKHSRPSEPRLIAPTKRRRSAAGRSK